MSVVTHSSPFFQFQEAVSRVEWHDLFKMIHSVCLWDDKGPSKVYSALREEILEFIKLAQERVLSHQEEQALLKDYIAEWGKFSLFWPAGDCLARLVVQCRRRRPAMSLW